MLLRDFIDKSINEVKSGIDKFNSEHNRHHASLPEFIDFELKVLVHNDINKNEYIVVNGDYGYSETEIQNIKLRINLLYYKTDKDR